MNPQRERVDAAVLIVLAIGAASIPFTLAGYEIKLATTITIQAGLAVALGFVVGPAGLISVGHAAFYGLAAYMLAYFAPQNEAANALLTLVLSIAAAAAFALFVGAVSIRSRGMYFILMTLAFGQLGYHFFHDTKAVGTADGAYVAFRPELRLPGLEISLDRAQAFYIFVYVVTLVVIGLCWWLRRSAFGSILLAARDNEARTRAFGYSPYLVRLVAFVISGAMAGAMGWLTAAQHGHITPQLLGWHVSAFALVMVLIGGKEMTSGPAIGAILLYLAEEVLQRWTDNWLLGIGILIILVVIVAPQGVVPYAASLLETRRPRHA
jgi:branched-chain amino acid transport system permease protein